MFCSKCGVRVDDGTRFCPKCGAQVGASSEPVKTKWGFEGPTPFARAMAGLGGRTRDVLWAVAQVVLVLVSLFPLLKLNVAFVGGEYSMFDLLTILGEVGGNSAANSVMVFVILLVVLWGAGIVAAAKTVVRVARGGDARPAAFTILSVFAFLFALPMFMIIGAFGDVVGYGLNPVSPTPWLWVLGVGAVVCNVCFHVLKR